MHPVKMLQHIVADPERFYVARFIDCFADKVSEAHQMGLLEFVVNEVGGNERWEKFVEDPYMHIELVKSVLMHYSATSGNKTDPTTDDLAELIEDYTKSSKFSEIEDAKDNVDKPSFVEMMEGIGEA